MDETKKPICGDCKAPVIGWDYRCWWCRVTFCQDCAPKHYGSPEQNTQGAIAERVKNAICDERIKILTLIADEQAFLTAGDKAMLKDRLLEDWSRRS